MPTNLNKRNAIDSEPSEPTSSIPIIILLAMMTAAEFEPALGLWISDAAQAEFVGSESSASVAERGPQSSHAALVEKRSVGD